MRVSGFGGADARLIVRPSLSPALPALAFAWLGVTLGSTASLDGYFGGTWAGHDPGRVALATLAVALVTVAIVAWRSAGLRAVCVAGLAGLMVGTTAGCLRTQQTLAQADLVTGRPASAYEFTVVGDPNVSALGGYSVQVDVRALSDEGVGRVVGRAWARLPDDANGLRLGSLFCAVGRWERLEDDEWDRALALRGCCAGLTVASVTSTGAQDGPLGALRAMRASMLEALDLSDDGLALAAGVVLGQQSSLSQTEAYRSFSNLGLTHLVAVSGSHLAVVAGIMAFGLRMTRARPLPRLGITLVALVAYVVLTALQPSAIRSLLMVATALAGGVVGRRSHALSALGLAALLLLLFDPTMAFSLGFSLSVLSVLGIACFGRLAHGWVCAFLPARAPESVTGSLALTLVAQAFTMPLTLPTFGVLPLLSPLANVLEAPLMSALLMVGLVSLPLASVLPQAAGVVLLPCHALGSACCRLAELLAGIPYAAVPLAVSGLPCALALVGVAIAAYAAWPRPSRRAATCLLAICGAGMCGVLFSWRFLAPARIVALDVGQGDAILVQQGSHALLVDTGPDDSVVLALGRMHVIHLDAVLLTHTDSDHVGGLDELKGIVAIDEVIVSRGTMELLASEKPELARLVESVGNGVCEVSAGDSIAEGRFDLEVIWPAGVVTESENGSSIVAVARYADDGGLFGEGRRLSVLLTGDAEREQVEPLVTSGAVGVVDVLKVGHHGSAVSTSARMLEGLRPSLAVASAGEGNRYGHPTQECVDVVTAAGVTFLCTSTAGDVELRPAVDGVRVRCQNEGVCTGAR